LIAQATLLLLLSIAATSAKATVWQRANSAAEALAMGVLQETAIPFLDSSSQQRATPFADAPMQPIPSPTPIAPIHLGPAPADPNELRISGLGGGSTQWTIVILLTFLTLIPSILICMTPFARLLIVFHFLRQALGLQTTPSNQTLIGLSVIMTFFLMQPVGLAIYRDSVVPLQEGKITAIDAVVRGGMPMRQFMSHYVREKDVALFLEIAKEPRPADINDVSFRVLLPSYILSELKAGFQIGAVLFLPFLVVDMVVASITTSVGMMQLPPVVISTPLKLLLFLMVDGWHLLIVALMRSFN
jgi:flagellar biosynthetic protein FliP